MFGFQFCTLTPSPVPYSASLLKGDRRDIGVSEFRGCCPSPESLGGVIPRGQEPGGSLGFWDLCLCPSRHPPPSPQLSSLCTMSLLTFSISSCFSSVPSLAWQPQINCFLLGISYVHRIEIKNSRGRGPTDLEMFSLPPGLGLWLDWSHLLSWESGQLMKSRGPETSLPVSAFVCISWLENRNRWLEINRSGR